MYSNSEISHNYYLGVTVLLRDLLSPRVVDQSASIVELQRVRLDGMFTEGDESIVRI